MEIPMVKKSSEQGEPSVEKENVLELGGDENLDFCGTLSERKKKSRFDDPAFREKFWHMMYDNDGVLYDEDDS